VSSQVSSPSLVSRRRLNARQAETVDKLLRAGQEVLEEVGTEELTIRMVAARAGVSPATAYTYVASKNHLFAELYLRHIAANPAPDVTGAEVERLQQVTSHFVATLLSHPHLAAAANIALLSSDPEVERLRLKIGAEFVGRFAHAYGSELAPDLLDALLFAFSGALLQAGMGLMDADELSERFDAVIALVVRGYR
jgi:AcrR family transcriptional regulator